MRKGGKVLGIAMAISCLAIPARADPIQITSGFLQWAGGSAAIKLAGGGFTFEGAGLSFGGIAPWEGCIVPTCVTGSTVDLRTLWVGNDLPGTATFGGSTFAQVGGLNSDSSLLVEWTGSLLIPSDFSGGTLTAPLSFSGRFSFFDNPNQTVVDLTGTGLATLQLTPFPGGNAFFFSSATYTFDEAVATPEPMSIVLVGTGLAGLAALRRRRKAKEVET